MADGLIVTISPVGGGTGYPILASKDVGWTLSEGVKPVSKTFEMGVEDAEKAGAINGPVKLTIDSGSGSPVEVKYLYVVHIVPTVNPNISGVTLADRRIWWSYKLINRLYNQRRNVGFKRLVDPSAAAELLEVDPKVWYRGWTLKNTSPNLNPEKHRWEAKDIIADVMKALMTPEKQAFGVNMPWKISTDISQKLSSLPIENFQLKESGDMALRRVLTMLPEAGVFVDYEGRVRFYSKVSGREANMVKAVSPAIVGHGDMRIVENKRFRPKKINVYFQYMSELRFNDTEDMTQTIQEKDRYCQNVLPCPDYSLEIKGGIDGKTVTKVAQGTWITFDEAFAAWGAPPGFNGPLTHDIVQKAMVPYMGLWAGIMLCGTMNPNADWAARISAIQNHYRRTYRLNRLWVDRVTKFIASRVAILNPATGTRAPALAYSDFSYLTGQRSLFNEYKSLGITGGDHSYAINVKGHPAKFGESASIAFPVESDDFGFKLKSTPGRVSLLDSDQGIVHVDYQIDPYRLYDSILPGMITMSSSEVAVDSIGRPVFPGPTSDLKNVGRPISFNAVKKSDKHNLPKLTARHKMSIILSATPGSPNSEASLYRVQRSYVDIKKWLPANMAVAVESLGPEMDIYIGPGIEVARVGWKDEAAEIIDTLFTDDELSSGDKSELIKPFVINAAKTSTIGASLEEIASAAAARMYATFADHYQGTMAGNMITGVTPAGWISEVDLTVTRSGERFVRIHCPEKLDPIDIFSFMDASTRAVSMKLATPEDAH